jgi:hypothetical protein
VFGCVVVGGFVMPLIQLQGSQRRGEVSTPVEVSGGRAERLDGLRWMWKADGPGISQQFGRGL